MADDEPILRQFLKSLDDVEGLKVNKNTLDSHLSILIRSLNAEAPATTQSLAYLILSKVIANARPKPGQATSQLQQAATINLVNLFAPPIQSRLSSAHPDSIYEAHSFFTALFHVDAQVASEIFGKDGVIESVMEASELFPGEEMDVAIASLLGQAGGQRACQAIMTSPDIISWLEDRVEASRTPPLRAAAAVALAKISKTRSDDVAGLPGENTEGASISSGDGNRDNKSLAQLMISLVKDSSKTVVSGAPAPSVEGTKAAQDAIECLAYLSTEPNIKEAMSNDAQFLKSLFSLAPSPRKHQTGPVPVVEIKDDTPSPRRTNLAFFYGIGVIIENITAYKPIMSEEEIQVDRLRKMARGGAATGRLEETRHANDSNQVLEENPAVRIRCSRLIKAGVSSALAGLSEVAGSDSVRRSIGRAMLNLVEDKEYRGKIIQSGGAKLLLKIIHASMPSSKVKMDPSANSPLPAAELSTKDLQLEAADLFAIQALAKLAITSSPILLFGPDASSSLDAVRPFSHLLRHSSSTLLQKFEALMALTNLASLGPQLSSRIAERETGCLLAVENLLLDDNVMVRRAATELLCNLVSSEQVWERYTGEVSDTQLEDDENRSSKVVASRIHILMALSDVDDAPTRLAASGALAMLTSSSNACRILLEEIDNGPTRILQILTGLISSEGVGVADSSSKPQLVHRGVVCVRNIFLNVPIHSPSVAKLVHEASRTGTVEKLQQHKH
ncbi:hypothetical protein FRC02_003113 [Tulasnella sp. 418]|nr:hypothetical protein FRC02_003113 [Tulasnella sp. 418]